MSFTLLSANIFEQIVSMLPSSFELGLITALTVLALFLSYSMLNVCDLSTDGCFTLGAVVGATVALSGHPYLSIFAAIIAGMLSGLITALLQTYLGVDSLLSGIIVNTALYSVNIAIMGNSSIVNLNKTETIFTKLKSLLKDSFLDSAYKIIIVFAAVALIILFLSFFLKTRLGLAIRATGNNPAMVKASSINPALTTIIGLCIANSFTGLSGCLMAQYQKSANIDIGSGILTVALASLLIGRSFMNKGKITKRAIGAVLGACIFRIVYSIALCFNMPASMLKLVSSIIVIIAVSGPYLQSKYPLFMRKLEVKGIKLPGVSKMAKGGEK
ncbi:MAG: ABC transporter permease [Lachnospiraceae bacterium]|nr:ABC transporter permease [Lachnospiraceae bacterium]